MIPTFPMWWSVFWYNFIFFPNCKKFSRHVEKWFHWVKSWRFGNNVQMLWLIDFIFSLITASQATMQLLFSVLWWKYCSCAICISLSYLKIELWFFFKKTCVCNCTDYNCAGPCSVLTYITTLCEAITIRSSFWCFKF